ncbi:chemotaxis protein CheA [uncultured Desulfovibrio sp.]|uniref:chemotaxis protein CheA n=2 Tax=uncultured Desulfovibrio sp. TaxID=167968 RepID=UPI00261FD0B2|nr:chemotaxis protein CheA [uncultured Desulfovibrio sp.]
MSQDFFDPELFADFINEAKEHLETIEPNLLELEKAPDNLALLNDIFRPMHSLKGASGFLGLNRINQLAHKSENILDELRKGTMVVTPEIMDVILSSTDALRQMVENLEATNSEGDVEIDHIIAQIEAIMNGEAAAPAAEAAPAEAPAAEAAPAEEAAPAAEAAEPAAAAEAPSAAPAAEAPAAVSPEAAGSEEAPGMSSKEWVASLPDKQEYALNAFGEGHLKDFIDESLEITGNLNDGLLQLEDGDGQEDLVNDLFRFFHNLKGNSGIIGYNELNALTHEAETLLNNVRQGKMSPSHELIDLLLLVVDVMETLVGRIDVASGKTRPFDTEPILTQLKKAVAGEEIALPPALIAAQKGGKGGETGDGKPVDVVTPVIIPMGAEGDDLDAFQATIKQQFEIINAALATLRKDGSHKDSEDALFRCLTAIKNASSFVGFNDVKEYAERTAGIVDQGRSQGIDFSLMVDLISQETAIIEEMATAAIKKKRESAPAAPEAAASEPAAPAAESEKVAPAAAPAAKPAAPAAPAAAPAAPAAAPAAKPAAAAAAPAAKPAAPAAPAAAPAAKPAAPAAKPAAAAAKPAAKPATETAQKSSSIRVDHERLDHLMNLIGELIINRNRYALIARSLESGGADVDISQVAQSLSETTYAMARISDDLQDTIMKVRMVPVSSVFSRFPRLVRDLSRKSGKEVDLVMEGEETELDKSVVEAIGDPLVHLIRNSVDHGIESEEARVAAGKSPKGRVTLRAFHKGNSVAIEIEDDGKGIDPEKMREVAIRKGIITAEEAAQLDDREAVELIFAPGFSSADKITDISGRGVGMDVVRTNIKNLKGSVSTNTELGKGTRFTLSLPLTLAIIDALMVNVSGQTYAIPLDAVSETTKIECSRLTDVKGRKAVTLRGEVLGIVELAEMLDLPRTDPLPEVLSVVVIHDNDRRLGLVVDRLLERQEIVIKPLGAYLGDLKGISGATIMGDGSVILILDPHEIYVMSTSKASNSLGNESPKGVSRASSSESSGCEEFTI